MFDMLTVDPPLRRNKTTLQETGSNNRRHRPSGRLQVVHLTPCRMLQGKSAVTTLLNSISNFSATRQFIPLFIRVLETHNVFNWFINTQFTHILHLTSTFAKAPYFQGFPKNNCVYFWWLHEQGRPLACWDFGFESHRRHGCLSVVSVACCQVEVSASGWSLIQRSPTDCVASLCVI